MDMILACLHINAYSTFIVQKEESLMAKGFGICIMISFEYFNYEKAHIVCYRKWI